MLARFSPESIDPFVRRTRRREKLAYGQNISSPILDAEEKVRSLNKMRRASRQGFYRTRVMGFLETVGFDTFGMGLPNIPLFTSSLAISLLEVGRMFGFREFQSFDMYYLLHIIQFALNPTEERLDRLKNVAKMRQETKVDERRMEEAIRRTSYELSGKIPKLSYSNGKKYHIAEGFAMQKLMKRLLDAASFAYELRRFKRTKYENRYNK